MLFFLKCIFEFIINAALQGSNSVSGREKYFKTISNGNRTEWSPIRSVIISY